MPFTPQKKDRGKSGSWPKPSPTAPYTVPSPVFSLQLVKTLLSPLLLLLPHGAAQHFKLPPWLQSECFCGRQQQPGWTLGFLHWKNFLLMVSATATVTSSALLLLQLLPPLFSERARLFLQGDLTSAQPSQGRHRLPHCSPF